MASAGYVHQNNPEGPERERLGKLEAVFNPRTLALLRRLGLGPGSRVLEAGAGAGGLLKPLMGSVGPNGLVTALDLNTRFFKAMEAQGLEVLEGDLTQMDLGRNRYNYIHERFVLTHLARPERIVEKMRNALRPGGWLLLLEDADFSQARIDSSDPRRQKAFAALLEARRTFFAGQGIDFTFGRALPALLAGAGFEAVGVETYAPADPGGTGIAEVMRLSTLHLRDPYLDTGAITEEELRTFVELSGDPAQTAVYYGTWSAWGRKTLHPGKT
jgi:SAM-dependent methyltransferase